MAANFVNLFCALFQWQVNLVLLDGRVQFSFLFDTSVYVAVQWTGTRNWDNWKLASGIHCTDESTLVSIKWQEKGWNGLFQMQCQLLLSWDHRMVLWEQLSRCVSSLMLKGRGLPDVFCPAPGYIVCLTLVLVRLLHKLIRLATLVENYPLFWFFAW